MERPCRRKRWRTRPTSDAGPPLRRKHWPMTPTNNVERPRRRKRWRTRPMSNAGLPRGTKRWPARLTSDVATSRPNALRLRQKKRLPRTSMTRTTTMLHGDLRHMPHPSLLALMPSWLKSEPWMTVSATGLHSLTRSLPRRTTKPQLQRCHPRHPQQPCCQPPTALLRTRTRSSLPWGGPFVQSLSLLHHCLARQLRLTANSRRHVAAANLVVVLAAAMTPGLPIHRSTFFVGGDIGPALPTNLL
jgi:hypothetical protein